MADWFENWFDTAYYHQLYANRNLLEAAEFVDRLLRYLQLPLASKVLDIGCGKGRHATQMAALGYPTWGIDLSACSIQEAKKMEHENLHFEVWDMRKTYRQNHFQLVVNLFSSFGYFEGTGNQEALHAMVGNLDNKGIFVMDYLNPEWVIKTMKPKEIIDRGNIQYHISKEISNGQIIKNISFLDGGQHFEFEERVRLITPTELNHMFQVAGLASMHHFGDYQLSPFQRAESPRQIIIAQKIA
ncbi:MAG: class I SAM-dependent methyltransferase [Chitinophagales bacterium]